MRDAGFPALGFDPAHGKVAAVRQIAEELSGTGRYAKEAHSVLDSIQQKRDMWTGKAADGFVDKLGELPEFLDGAHRSLTGAGKALSTWGDRLEQHQIKAVELENAARKAIGLAEQADTRAANAAATANTPIAAPAGDAGAEAQARANTEAATQAGRAAGEAWDKVTEIRRQARNLQDSWLDDARICIEALNNAADGAPASGILDAIGDGLRDAVDWAKDNLGDLAGLVSAIAGILAFIPVLTPFMAPVALAAGAIALGAHATEMVVEGKWDDLGAWVELGGDVVGLIPGVGALGKGIDAAGESLAGVDKFVDVTKATGFTGMVNDAGEAALAGGRAFVKDMSKPSAVAEWMANRAIGPLDAFTPMANNLAKGLEGSVTVGLQAPQAAALADGSPQAQQAGEAASAGSSFLSGITAIPRVGLGF